MRSAIVVRKKHTQRLGVRCLFVFVLAIVVGYVTLSRELLLIVAFSPSILCLLFVLIYYETWQITFCADSIRTKVFFLNTGNYTYVQVMDVIQARSYTEYDYIELSFKNKKRIRFRLEDENAGKAVKIIIQHHSIRKTRKTD